MKNCDPAAAHPLPCVVQLGFAGSRQLFPEGAGDPGERALCEAAVEDYLVGRMGRLRDELGLRANHFFVGISQIACGADTLFARACLRGVPQPIPQRFFLPQPRELFLSAAGSNGTPDFTPLERAEAERLLAERHVIQERVVSQAAEREARFQDANAEILRVSDAIVCLLREEAADRPGGTNELLERAKRRGTPVLEVRVGLAEGKPAFREAWHNLDDGHPFQPPQLPDELAHDSVRVAREPLPSQEEYCEPLKKLVSTQARWHQRLFKFSAVAIIATHILATIGATLALAFHERGAEAGHGVVALLLGIELLLLAAGFGIHLYLHHSHAARVWSIARVVAELARSLRAIGPQHVDLKHLFRLQLPQRFRPLLRTLNVLHLRSTWPNRAQPWQPQRDLYLRNRIDDQVRFYETQRVEDRQRLSACQWVFALFSLVAIAAASVKLALLLGSHGPPAPATETWLATLGTLAIVSPVLAVGALSWAAALDSEARVETFGETLDFLRRQRPLLEQAASSAEFDRLVVETETALLGETANWYSRRSNTGVAG